MTSSEIQNWITFFTAFLALLALIYQIRSSRKQIQLQNYIEFTKRYQSIILEFPESINEHNFIVESHEKRDKIMRYMRAYFDLCFEEFYLHQEKYIDDELWKTWEGGIKFAFTKPAFQQAWKVIKNDTKYSLEFNEFIEN